MCSLPEWFSELLSFFSEAEIKLIGAIARAGRDECSEAGGQPCTTLRARVQKLADDAGIAPRSAISASLSLEAEGVLTVFLSSNPHGENKYVLYVVLPRRHVENIKEKRRAKIAPLVNEKCKIFTPLEKESIKEKGTPVDVVDKYPVDRYLSTTKGVVKGNRHANFARLLESLNSLGVVGAEKLLAQFPLERAQAALDYVTDPLAKNIRTQAGYFIYLLNADFSIPDPPSKTKSLIAPPIPTWTGPASASASRTWEQALGQLRMDISDTNYKTWLAGTVGLAYQDGKFIIGVPSRDKLGWLSMRLSSLVRGRLNGVVGEDVDVEFQLYSGNLVRR